MWADLIPTLWLIWGSTPFFVVLFLGERYRLPKQDRFQQQPISRWMYLRDSSYVFGDPVSRHILGCNYECISLIGLIWGLWLWLCMCPLWLNFPSAWFAALQVRAACSLLALWRSSIELMALLPFWPMVYHTVCRCTATSSQKCINATLYLHKYAVS